jgi:DNA-directed RNA polymerase subunit RPC12/RpoP
MMSHPIYYVQECPTCGRRLQIRVEYLGRQVVCPHCQAKLTAADPDNPRCDPGSSTNSLLRRADELLESVTQRQAASRRNPR